jgi:hypothetical protein
MNYRSLAFILAVALPALATAGSGDQSTSDKDTNNKVACIVDFVTSGLDQEKHDSFIEDCLKKKMANQQAGGAKQG